MNSNKRRMLSVTRLIQVNSQSWIVDQTKLRHRTIANHLKQDEILFVLFDVDSLQVHD